MAITDLEDAVKAAVLSPGRRTSLGPNPTFGGVGGIPVLLPSLVTQQDSVSLSFYSLDVAASATPAAAVPRGGVKPTAATVSVSPRVVGKFAGRAKVQAEDYWESEGALYGVSTTLLAQCAVAADTAANATLTAAVPAAVPATSWIAAISGGQAAVNSVGGRPNLVVIPSGDWSAVAAELAAAPGLGSPSGDVMLNVLGSRVVLSPQGVTAFVLDPEAATNVLRDIAVLVDDDGTGTNTFDMVVDLVSALFATRPSGIVAIAAA